MLEGRRQRLNLLIQQVARHSYQRQRGVGQEFGVESGQSGLS